MAVEPFNELENLGVARHTLNAIMNSNWPQYKSAETTVTFAGGTENAIGDYDGTGNPVTMFSVTGLIEVSIIAICTTSLTGGSATIEVGTAKKTAGLIAQTTATDLLIDELWHDASPDSTIELTSVATRNLVSEDIILTVATANVTAGVISFIVRWAPISSDGELTVA